VCVSVTSRAAGGAPGEGDLPIGQDPIAMVGLGVGF
jgi:hypothetical protein